MKTKTKTSVSLALLVICVSQFLHVAAFALEDRSASVRGIVTRLPLGFHGFRPVSGDISSMQFPSTELVLCREMPNAISYGKQLWLGADPHHAVRAISAAWSGALPCKFVEGLWLRALESAVRGDDMGRPVLVIKWADQFGRSYYTGWPKPMFIGR